MHIVHRIRQGASAFALSALIGTTALTAGAGSAAAAIVPPQIPQVAVAQAAANWLVSQQAASGEIGGTLSNTVNAVVALAAANVTPNALAKAVSYVEANLNSYITVDGADGPGQLANLILDAHDTGNDPTNFGGTNLVTRLAATEQTVGTDAGLYGTETQLNDFFVGTYDQGLVFSALAAIDKAPDSSAVQWLLNQQCSSGGWAFPNNSITTCAEDQQNFEGADNQSTSLVVQGLAAQNLLTPTISSAALGFFAAGQDADAGWGYNPSTVAQPQESDSQSTSLVIEALLALGDSPTATQFTHGGQNPVSTLLSFVLPSGPNAGALGYQDNISANVLATDQDLPVLMGFTLPFSPVGHSYLAVSAAGGVVPFGGAVTYGSLGASSLNKPIVGMATTPDTKGYWLVASDGGVFSFGDATFYGSTGALHLNKPIVGMAATPDGKGYWLVASDGGIFSFGDAAFQGSTGSLTLNKPIVGMGSSADGGGYWLVASDGGVFTFGDAVFHGSTGNITLNKPIVGMAATPDGGGYWLVASDGGIFSFGDAAFHGSTGALHLNKPIVGMAATPDGGGYWLVASDGGVFTFGDAMFSGSGAGCCASAIVGIAGAFS